MAYRHATLTFNSEDDTARFAAALGMILNAGDTVMLKGDIGAGKTFLARALIQSLQDDPEDVPSPTFTLVQTYETRAGEVWHSDLYRIGSTEELEELGLFDAFETAICLVEWPDRLGDETPKGALCIKMATDPSNVDQRSVTIKWQDETWSKRLAEIQGLVS